MKLRHAQHRSIDRMGVARYQGLQRLHQCRADHDGVNAVMRHGGMRAMAGDLYVELIGRGHHRSGHGGKLAHRQAGPVMHAENAAHRPALEQAIIDHGLATTLMLFCRLKNKMHHAVEVTRLGQVLRRTQQHGGVAIMPASMHASGMLRAVGKVVAFFDRQRIHIGPQADGMASLLAVAQGAGAQAGHDAGATHAARDLQAPGFQPTGYCFGGVQFLKRQFRMGVNVAPKRRQCGLQREDVLVDVDLHAVDRPV